MFSGSDNAAVGGGARLSQGSPRRGDAVCASGIQGPSMRAWKAVIRRLGRSLNE